MAQALKTPSTRSAIIKKIKEMGLTPANMPDNGGFYVSQVLWEMVPVFLVSWAYAGSNMRERALTEEVESMRTMLQGLGCKTQTKGNLFFVLPEQFASLAD